MPTSRMQNENSSLTVFLIRHRGLGEREQLAAFKKLRDRCDGTGAVIRKPSGIELQSSRRWFETCLLEAKVEDFHWHDFRHVFGSRLRAANVQIEDIRYLLGHGAKSITERYAHPNMDVLRLAVAKLDRKSNAAQSDTKTDTVPVLEFRTAVNLRKTPFSLGILVDETGIEPATSSLRTRRSPS